MRPTQYRLLVSPQNRQATRRIIVFPIRAIPPLVGKFIAGRPLGSMMTASSATIFHLINSHHFTQHAIPKLFISLIRPLSQKLSALTSLCPCGASDALFGPLRRASTRESVSPCLHKYKNTDFTDVNRLQLYPHHS